MEYLIDTHCHLHDREFFDQEQARTMLKGASKRGVLQLICIGTNDEDSRNARDFAKAHKNVFWTYGVHPEHAGSGYSFESSEKLVAIGEIGLDYHYPDYDKKAQIQLLEEMLQLAVDNNLPCSFHVREAMEDFFAVIKSFPSLKPSVLHSFTDSKTSLITAMDKGFYIGINGIATFAKLECFKDLSPEFLDRFVLETDAPFLTPEPNRGKINEPGNVSDVAKWLANKMGVSETKIAEKTTKNARFIFNLPNPEPESCEDGTRRTA